MCSLFSFPLLLIFSIFFYQNPLFSFEMEILTSQKGKPQLALDGFLYIMDKNDKKIYWKCVRNPECRRNKELLCYVMLCSECSVLYLNSYNELYVAKQKKSTAILYFRLHWSLI